jgi:hypothetical protein
MVSMSYEEFRDKIRDELKASDRPLSWSEIREHQNLPQKFPNNQWVHRMESDIALHREKHGDKTLWRLGN